MKLEDGRTLDLIGTWFKVSILLPEQTSSGLAILNRDPSNQDTKPDCYQGTVLETSAQCSKVKIADAVVFTRWYWSQQEMEEGVFLVPEKDLVVVNDKCVNGHIAVQLFDPFKKVETLVLPENARPKRPPYRWGRVMDIDHSSGNTDTKEVIPGDVVRINYLEDYQYRIGEYTLVFKDMWGVVDFIYGHVPIEKEKELAYA